MAIRGSIICPFNVLNLSGKPTYCHDGQPSAQWDKEGEDYCGSYVYVNITLCRTNHCEVVVDTGVGSDGFKERFRAQLCGYGDCPYNGCRRLKTIKDLPLATIIRQERWEDARKEKTGVVQP
jgi:hypothetical protein